MRNLIIFLLFVSTTIAQNKELTIVSWNIQYFGKTKNAKEIDKIAEIVKHADIIAIQEVVSSYGGRQAVARLTAALNAKGERWDYLLSDKTNSTKYMTERYAIIWKNKRIKIEDDDSEKIEIEFITFDDLIHKYSIKLIDKLQIDIEGAEFKVMNSIDYDKIRINQIFFESKHFDGTFQEGKKLAEIKNKLLSSGFKLEQIDKENILATNINDNLIP